MNCRPLSKTEIKQCGLPQRKVHWLSSAKHSALKTYIGVAYGLNKLKLYFGIYIHIYIVFSRNFAHIHIYMCTKTIDEEERPWTWRNMWRSTQKGLCEENGRGKCCIKIKMQVQRPSARHFQNLNKKSPLSPFPLECREPSRRREERISGAREVEDTRRAQSTESSK